MNKKISILTISLLLIFILQNINSGTLQKEDCLSPIKKYIMDKHFNTDILTCSSSGILSFIPDYSYGLDWFLNQKSLKDHISVKFKIGKKSKNTVLVFVKLKNNKTINRKKYPDWIFNKGYPFILRKENNIWKIDLLDSYNFYIDKQENKEFLDRSSKHYAFQTPVRRYLPSLIAINTKGPINRMRMKNHK